ncbi:hypothetical protein BH20VER3_BH20VER3_02720 [soil metagenome]
METIAQLRDYGQSLLNWIKRRPADAFLLAALGATLVYFFGFLKLYADGHLSTLVWAWQAWNPETNYEHAKLIPLIALVLVWTSREKLRRAPLGSSRWGLAFVAFGLLLFLVAARTLQARIALVALPFLLFGVVLHVWGRRVARILLFPIAFLFFAVPLNFLAQATVSLQFIETGAASAICNLVGIGVRHLGTTIVATDETFRFSIDEGCSGIRSLMAIAMLSAIYGHYAFDRLWKKLANFAAALLFAIIGNAGRLVSIMVVAKWFGQDLAGGPYHSASGFLSFPFAIGAMLLFGKLLNLQSRRAVVPPTPQEAV